MKTKMENLKETSIELKKVPNLFLNKSIFWSATGMSWKNMAKRSAARVGTRVSERQRQFNWDEPPRRNYKMTMALLGRVIKSLCDNRVLAVSLLLAHSLSRYIAESICMRWEV
jgi:hypothetical protein